jgi:ribose-phosphate pyrophosphokinase
MLKITDNFGNEIGYSLLKFSGGELQPRVDRGIKEPDRVRITSRLTSSDSIMELILGVDAIRRSGRKDSSLDLICPYLPYARQDRVCAAGESLALKVMCDIINDLGFSNVYVWDPHSEVSLALLNNVCSVSQDYFVAQLLRSRFSPKREGVNLHLVAPDAGSLKKIYVVSKQTKLPIVRADKTRDPNTGEITGTVVYSESVGSDDFLIVDDICDGGRTFIELAKELRPLTTGKIYLYVTHGIFSKGLDVFNGLIDHVYTAHPFPEVNLDHPLLTVL